ncbi:hypothetical protein, partial [Enterobacter cloacae complex sp. 275J9]|uniref:hypothetical protein n=1 Tax=Enterobacter cloacae complex sp. 275J9 TaxID=3395880 RepID=UPI003CECC241
APSAKGDDKFITTDYLQQCPSKRVPRQGTKPMPIRTPATRYRQIEAYPNLMSDVEHKQRQSRVLIYIY